MSLLGLVIVQEWAPRARFCGGVLTWGKGGRFLVCFLLFMGWGYL